ncbi:MAG: class I SAM-dependent methyltransferase [Deltaproteobacteria bacterium]|nr:class I SAM-dependent methyltransferase [Deltaproteobacteria bacterium]
MKDEATEAYFNEYTPEYGVYRFEYAVGAIRRLCKPGSSFVDVGCGVGNILEFIRNETPIENLCGIDVSENCLREARARVNCETYAGSIVDARFVSGIKKRFDFVMLAAVLHHLIGPAKRECRRMCEAAVANSLSLVKDGGYLIVLEPTINPAFSTDLIYHVKRLVTRVTTRRVGIFDKWNNIGAPVVAYFTDYELVDMLKAAKGCKVEDVDVNERQMNLMYRLALMTKRAETTVLVRKTAAR